MVALLPSHGPASGPMDEGRSAEGQAWIDSDKAAGHADLVQYKIGLTHGFRGLRLLGGFGGSMVPLGQCNADSGLLPSPLHFDNARMKPCQFLFRLLHCRLIRSTAHQPMDQSGLGRFWLLCLQRAIFLPETVKSGADTLLIHDGSVQPRPRRHGSRLRLGDFGLGRTFQVNKVLLGSLGMG